MKKFIMIIYKNGTFDLLDESKVPKIFLKEKDKIKYILIPIQNEFSPSYLCILPENFREDFIYAKLSLTIGCLSMNMDSITIKNKNTKYELITNIFDMYRTINTFYRMQYVTSILNKDTYDYYNSVTIIDINIEMVFKDGIKKLKYQLSELNEIPSGLEKLCYINNKVCKILSDLFNLHQDNEIISYRFNLETKRYQKHKLFPMTDTYKFTPISNYEFLFMNIREYHSLGSFFINFDIIISNYLVYDSEIFIKKLFSMNDMYYDILNEDKIYIVFDIICYTRKEILYIITVYHFIKAYASILMDDEDNKLCLLSFAHFRRDGNNLSENEMNKIQFNIPKYKAIDSKNTIHRCENNFYYDTPMHINKGYDIMTYLKEFYHDYKNIIEE